VPVLRGGWSVVQM